MTREIFITEEKLLKKTEKKIKNLQKLNQSGLFYYI